jgi:acyl carrier protein
MTDIENKLIDLAARRFERPRAELTAEADFFEQLGIDSYQAMDMLTELEETFGVEIPDYEVQGVTTLRGLAEVIARRI